MWGKQVRKEVLEHNKASFHSGTLIVDVSRQGEKWHAVVRRTGRSSRPIYAAEVNGYGVQLGVPEGVQWRAHNEMMQRWECEWDEPVQP